MLNPKVYWQSDDQPKELNFFSISSDGRVASWVMSKNELKMEPVMQLKLVNTIKVTYCCRNVSACTANDAKRLQVGLNRGIITMPVELC